MTTQNLIPFPQLQFFDNNGVPLAGGSVTTYAADGVTPKATYQDQAGTISNTNPITLDSAGRAQIWGTGQYVFLVQDSLGNTIYNQPTADPTYELNAGAFGLSLLETATQADAQTLLGFSTFALSPGVMLPYGGASAPSGWHLCDGTAVSRASNPQLFSAIGTAWGTGDGSTTFNLPDMRGRVFAGVDGSAGRLTSASDSAFGASAALGNVGGNQLVQTHTHTTSITDPGHTHTYTQAIGLSGGASSGLVATPQAPSAGTGTTGSSTTGITLTGPANFGSGSSQNVQPTAVGNWIIQLV
jgi:microcystin-dependent protein